MYTYIYTYVCIHIYIHRFSDLPIYLQVFTHKITNLLHAQAQNQNKTKWPVPNCVAHRPRMSLGCVANVC